MSPTPLLLLLLFLPLQTATAVSFSFPSPSFSFQNITLLGTAFLRNASLGLTREAIVPTTSLGTAFYSLPIPTAFAHFSTNFTFLITNTNPSSPGDGLSFFLSPSLSPFNYSNSVTIEFDTRLDPQFSDPSNNHVGLDVSTPVSLSSADLDTNLTCGNPITASVVYDGKNVTVSLADTPVLSARIDIPTEYAYVGFSASARGSTALHTVLSWSFESSPPPSPLLPVNNNNNFSAAAATVTAPCHSRRRELRYGLGILGPVVGAVAFVVVLWVSIKKAMRRRGFKPSEFLKGPRQFSYSELKSSTKGFSDGRILGNGAFGTVYRGDDPKTGTSYAVKRSKRATNSRTEFAAELAIIASLRHKNLVQLQGWCCDKAELLLVYEFMPNGSLDRVLYGPSACVELDYPRRYNVAAGLAAVLTYLHQECDQRVIHRDIKTSNIMLDSEFNARLGDFGLARLMDHDKSPVSTLTAGTMGYLAPEYLQYGKFTEKTDVFSYGIVVLEVCCGRRPIDKDGNLVDWVWALYSQDKLIEAVDARLNGAFDIAGMLRMLLVGLSCVNPKCDERPSMRRVVQILNREAEPLPVPKAKPLLMFCSSASLSLQEIVSDIEASAMSSSLYELKVDSIC